MSVSFSLPWPPSLNRYYRAAAGRVLVSKAGREYRDLVCLLGLPKAPAGRLRVELVLHAPCRRRSDIDNFQKCAFDALTHAGVWPDDSVVDEMLVRRGEVVKGGRIDVVVRLLGERGGS